MATWPVLFTLVGISCGVCSSGDVLLALQGVTEFPAETTAGVHMKNELKWLLLMKEGLTQARIAKIRNEVPRLGFYASLTRVWEYMGTKDQIERDLKKVNFKDDVEHWIMDVEMAVVPETPDVRAKTPPTSGMWGLQRMGAGKSKLTGRGIRAFVFDTGIVESHPGFGGRVIPEFDMTITPEGHAAKGMDTGACRELKVASCSHDHHGHGTHIAGTIAGQDVGVAPGATLHAMKVAGDKGHGRMSWVVRGFNHMFSHFEVPRDGFASQTLIATLTLRAKTKSLVLDSVINTAVSEAGIVVVVAAGNRAEDACGYTPANVAGAFTIGAVDSEMAMPRFSNYGSCVHLFAPGVSIQTLAVAQDSKFGKNGQMRATGTSMAVPHVAGAMALLLEENPALGPADLKELVRRQAVTNAIQGDLQGSPNKVLHLGDHVACADTEGWRDAKGWTCASWRWSLFSNCDAGSMLSSYTKAELDDIKLHCSGACGLCA